MKKKKSTHQKLFDKYCMIKEYPPRENWKNRIIDINEIDGYCYNLTSQKYYLYIILCKRIPIMSDGDYIHYRLDFCDFKKLLNEFNDNSRLISILDLALEEINLLLL
jgi:hypothetical protein